MIHSEENCVHPWEDDVGNHATEHILSIFQEADEISVRAAVSKAIQSGAYDYDIVLELATDLLLVQDETNARDQASNQGIVCDNGRSQALDQASNQGIVCDNGRSQALDQASNQGIVCDNGRSQALDQASNQGIVCDNGRSQALDQASNQGIVCDNGRSQDLKLASNQQIFCDNGRSQTLVQASNKGIVYDNGGSQTGELIQEKVNQTLNCSRISSFQAKVSIMGESSNPDSEPSPASQISANSYDDDNKDDEISQAEGNGPIIMSSGVRNLKVNNSVISNICTGTYNCGDGFNKDHTHGLGNISQSDGQTCSKNNSDLDDDDWPILTSCKRDIMKSPIINRTPMASSSGFLVKKEEVSSRVSDQIVFIDLTLDDDDDDVAESICPMQTSIKSETETSRSQSQSSSVLLTNAGTAQVSYGTSQANVSTSSKLHESATATQSYSRLSHRNNPGCSFWSDSDDSEDDTDHAPTLSTLISAAETAGINENSHISADMEADEESFYDTFISNPNSPCFQTQNTSTFSGTMQASSVATHGNSSISSSIFSGVTATAGFIKSETTLSSISHTTSSRSTTACSSVKREVDETGSSPRLLKKARTDNINVNDNKQEMSSDTDQLDPLFTYSSFHAVREDGVTTAPGHLGTSLIYDGDDDCGSLNGAYPTTAQHRPLSTYFDDGGGCGGYLNGTYPTTAQHGALSTYFDDGGGHGGSLNGTYPTTAQYGASSTNYYFDNGGSGSPSGMDPTTGQPGLSSTFSDISSGGGSPSGVDPATGQPGLSSTFSDIISRAAVFTKIDLTTSQHNPSLNQAQNIPADLFAAFCQKKELKCDVCKSQAKVDKCVKCNYGHLVCKCCLQEEVDSVINSQKTCVQCPEESCDDIFTFETMKSVLSTLYFDAIKENIAKKQAAASEKTLEEIGTMSCPSCSYQTEVAENAKRFKCANPNCQKVCCKYCKSVWIKHVHAGCFILKFSGREYLENHLVTHPDNWISHDKPGIAYVYKNERYLSVDVMLDSEEGKAVCIYFARTSRRTVIGINRIQNEECWEKYALSRKHMIQRNGRMNLNEKFLFHGTAQQNIVTICNEGFDFRKTSLNGTRYGKANYFSTKASYSEGFAHGSNAIFLVRVLCGITAVGNGDNQHPPYVNDRMCDSCVDTLNKPLMYMLYTNDQCYPEYLIQYK